jgi:GDPmannose 4,6-dehydratase
MLQADEPADYVLATGTSMTVREFVETAFDHAGLDWERHVRYDEAYVRPTEVDVLVGNPARAHERLGWKATVLGADLARIMVDADIEALAHEGRHWIDRPAVEGWPGRPRAAS